MERVIEEWRKVPNTIGYYISNIGRLKIEEGTNKKYPKGIIKDTFYKDKDGYYKVTYRLISGKSKGKHIHRLVAEAFIPNCDEERTCVNHIDNDRNNNCVSNLEWVTPKENVYHSFIKGKRKICLQVPRTSKLTSY